MKDLSSPATFLRVDIVLILSVAALTGLGIAFIYSSGVTSTGVQMSREWLRQIIWAITGTALMAAFALIDYRRWKQWAVIVYGAVLVLLIAVLLAGKYVKGARAWLGVGSIGLQPSEFGKLAVILMLGWWFDEWGKGLSNLKSLLGAALITGIPVLLIVLQPDLGTAFVYLPVLWTVALAAEINWKLMIFPVLAGILAAAGILGYAWNEYIAEASHSAFRIFSEKQLFGILSLALLFINLLLVLGWVFFRQRVYLTLLYIHSIITVAYLSTVAAIKLLKGYQVMRLVVFLDPQIDPRGAGWHIIQSVTAVGSGGILGKGFLQGTQSHYNFLPEQSTDFIFSILAEETGFIGGLMVFGLYALIIIRALYIAYTSQDRFGTFLAVGIAAMVAFHVIQNIGMAIGVMPITGIPLFFLSYGGSSLWMVMMAMGVLISIHYRRNR